jgi:hypothetical protein
VNPRELVLSSGELEVYGTPDTLMPDLLYIQFSGRGQKLVKKGYCFQLTVDGKSLGQGSEEGDFLYIGDTSSLPGEMRCGDYLKQLCILLNLPVSTLRTLELAYIQPGDLKSKINRLADYKQGELLLLPLRLTQRRCCLVKDAGKGMPIEFIIDLKDRLEKLAGTGSLVLYITSEDGLPHPRSIKDKPVLLIPVQDWKSKVDYFKKQLAR